jgi:hypothetical protein
MQAKSGKKGELMLMAVICWNAGMLSCCHGLSRVVNWTRCTPANPRVQRLILLYYTPLANPSVVIIHPSHLGQSPRDRQAK